jgi:hypothetical protein
MKKTGKTYTYTQLAIAAWLMEAPDERVLSQGLSSSGGALDIRFRYRKQHKTEGHWFYSHLDTLVFPLTDGRVAASNEEYLDTRHMKFSLHPLTKDDILDLVTGHHLHDKSIDTPSKRLVLPNAGRYSLSESFYVMNENGRKWWHAGGREQYREALTARFAKEAADKRTILIGFERRYNYTLSHEQKRLFPTGFPPPLPSRKLVRPYAIATVVKETDQGYFVTDVKPLTQRLKGLDGGYIPSPLEDRKPHPFAPRSIILADRVSPEAVEEVMTVDAEVFQDITDTQSRTVDELLPILRHFHDLQLQQEARHDDLMKAALSKADGSARPEDPEAGPKP